MKCISTHVPVLLHEVIELLNLAPGMNVIDGTLGGGGHAEVMLEKIGPQGRLLGIDTDPEAIERVTTRLKRFGERVTLVKENFRNLKIIRDTHFQYPVSAVLLDLGVSSDQLDDPGRGFSFLADGPLDMRLGGGRDATTSAATEAVNGLPEAELARIIRMRGEERFARSIAHSIVVSRRVHPLETTHQLVSAILRALPPHARRQKLHPATRTFQALRIYVNQELEALREALPQAVDALMRGGRCAVISFHSLEDRIVKQYFAGCIRRGITKDIARKPVCADEREVRGNPRSRSAKLRVIEKL